MGVGVPSDSLITVSSVILGPYIGLVWETKMPPQRESNFHWTGQNLIMFWYTPNGSPNKNCDTRAGLHSIAWDTFQTIVSPPLLRCRHDAIPGKLIDWLWLCLQGAAIKELFEVCGWDYVHEVFLPFLNFGETFLAWNSFVQPLFCHRWYHCIACWARDRKAGW